MVNTPDLVEDRQAWLLERLADRRRVHTVEVAAELDVSVDTIRRDLRALHERGLLRRVHGGAVPVSRLPGSFAGRAAESGGSRARLAAAIVERFRPGQVIGLDAGTTGVDVAAAVPPTLAVTIVTNNPAAAVALADHPAAEVALLGGAVDLTWMATVGAEVVDGWRAHRLDLGVVGVCGFDPTVGVMTNSRAEVSTKRALLEASAETIVPLQPEKLGASAPFVVAGPDAVDVLVVERSVDGVELIERARSAAIEVVTAGYS